MKKSILLMVVMWVLLCMSGVAQTVGGNVTLAAVINPSNWGLDQVITQVIAALGSFVVGLFLKSPADKKNKKNN